MASTYASTKSLFKMLVSYDQSQWRWRAGARNAIGLGIPLVVGPIVHEPIPAIAVTVGALVTGFASLNGTLRKRFRTMRTAMIWMGIATGIGTALGHYTTAIILLVLVSGFWGGLAVSLGLETMQIGILATTALIIFSAFPEPWPIAGEEALLVMLGSALQMALLWLFQKIEPSTTEEERGLLAVLDAMTRYLEAPGSSGDLDMALTLVKAEEQLNDSNLPIERWARLKSILDLLEAIRNDVLAVSLPDVASDLVQQEDRMRIIQRLQAIRRGLTMRMPAARTSGQRMDTTLAPSTRYVHLTTLLDTAVGFATGQPLWQETLRHPPTRFRHRLWPRLRANLTMKSQAFRHAIRLALTLALAVLLYRLLPLNRGYWVPITVLVILRPDFQATFGRGLARVVGTALGIILATGLLILAAPDRAHIVGVTLVVGFGLALYATLNVNYAIFSVFITAMVVVLLSFFEHAPVALTLEDRLLNTVVGSAIALGAYALWPTWQREQVPSVLAQWLIDEREYLRALTIPGKDVARARKAVRLSRTNTVAVVNQAALEPVRSRLDPVQLGKLMAALHHLTEILMTLEFTLPQALGNAEAKSRFLNAVPLWCNQLDQLAKAISKERDAEPSVTKSEDWHAIKDYWDITRRQLERDLLSMQRAQLWGRVPARFH